MQLIDRRELTLGRDRLRLEVGRDLLDEVTRWFSARRPRGIVIVTDDHVRELHAAPIVARLGEVARVDVVSIPPGEGSKRLRALERVMEQALELGITRQTCLVSFGGGVVSNLAGVAAGLLFRGMPFVDIPTSIVAQIDASISRKQAVNSRRGKNLFGLWKSPEAIFVDMDYLHTLDRRQVRTGLAEAIKLALIADLAEFERLEALTLDDLISSPDLLEGVILRAIDLTCLILAEDPDEGTSGSSLEIGHTVGHAVEILENGRLTHGEAIAIGMVIEAALSVQSGALSRDWLDRIHWILARYELPTRLPAHIGTGQVMGALRFDNKRTGFEPTFVPICDPGRIRGRAGSSEHPVIFLERLESAAMWMPRAACERVAS
jgi:3-dehydroquinate synthase